MSTFYEKEGVVKATADLAKKEMIVKWQSLSNDDAIEACCQAQLELVKNGMTKLYIDVADASGVPSQDRQTWFESFLFPAFSKHGLKVSVTILPKSALTKLASKKWVKIGVPFSFDTFEAADLASARELAEKY